MQTGSRSCPPVRLRSIAPGSAQRTATARQSRTPARNQTWQRTRRKRSSQSLWRATSTSMNLRRVRNALPAADQPPNSGKIEDADPQAVEKPIIRRAVLARPVDHVDIPDIFALAARQRRQKPMQPIEDRQCQSDVARKCLQPAAGVARAVAQDRAADRVCDARLKSLEAGVL